MYVVQDGIYCIKGGVLKIPQQYRTNSDGNLIISGQFFQGSA
jgi:hypothetical protein